MRASTCPRSRLLQEFKASKNDDELRLHLRARLAESDPPHLPTFIHDRLEHARQFRLVTLLPGALEDAICCSMKTFELDNPPTFRALSYAWGDKTRTLPIECDQRTTNISINLYSALLRVRSPDQEVNLWIDALCIDQATDEVSLRERAEQVRRMDQIFTRADEVIIDLGGSTTSQIDHFMKGYHDFQRFPVQGSSYGIDDPFWKTLTQFFGRPWFSRVWILQEFILARRAIMMMGSAKIDPSSLNVLSINAVLHRDSIKADTLTRLLTGRLDVRKVIDAEYRSGGGGLHNDMVPYQNMCRMSGRKQSLSAVLDLSRRMEASDPRDHIYALAGLTKNWDAFDIPIDYIQGEAVTRLSVGRALIRTGQSFYCLSRASGIDTSAMTWMPLLRSEPFDRHRNQDATTTFMGLHYSQYKAAGSTICEADVSDSHAFLAVTAFRVDTIESLAPSLPIMSGDPVHIARQDLSKTEQNCMRWYLALKTWTIQTFSDWSPDEAKHKLWRTMLLDLADEGTRFPPAETTTSPSLLTDRFEWLERLSTAYTPGNSSSETEQALVDQGMAHVGQLGTIWNICNGRKMCSTEKGRIANVPPKSAHGNEIWIILGIPLPMVLRNLGPAYAIVGPAYVHGLMDGEAQVQTRQRKETIYLA